MSLQKKKKLKKERENSKVLHGVVENRELDDIRRAINAIIKILNKNRFIEVKEFGGIIDTWPADVSNTLDDTLDKFE